MCAQEFAAVGVKDDFNETFGGAHGDGLAVGHEGEFTNVERLACRACLGFGVAHAGHLRVAVGARGDAERVQRMRGLPGDFLYADHRFMAGLVRQPRRPGKVANGVHARFVGATVVIDLHMAALDLDPCPFEPKVFNVAHNPGRHQHHIGL